MEQVTSATKRHVSRWRAPTDAPQSETASHSPRAPPPVSLRYLDEFVRKLQCSPQLLEHQLFPDAKEITESMGLFDAVRRFLIRDDEDHEQAESNSEPDGDVDGIVIVGDGNTPRTAALLAYRLRHWRCYSVDPAMEQHTERAQSWESIENLVVIRNKIENVRIELRRVVLVLVHAHVTLAQALSAVVAREVVGLVTMPCCNWYGQQEVINGRHPDVVFDDFSILSDHRELRVWMHPLESGHATSHEMPRTVDQSGEVMKGCVQKYFDARIGQERDSDRPVSVNAPPREKKREASSLDDAISALTVLAQLLGGIPTDDDDADDADDEKMERESHKSPTALHEMDQVSAVSLSSALQGVLPRKEDAILVLDPVLIERGASVPSNPPRHAGLVDSLIHAGYSALYMISHPTISHCAETHATVLSAYVIHMTAVNESDHHYGQLEIRVSGDKGSHSATRVKIRTHLRVLDNSGGGDKTAPLFTSVIDNQLLYRGFRAIAKKKSAAFFEQLLQLVQSCLAETGTEAKGGSSPSLVTITPRKDWRKVAFLANPRLQLRVAAPAKLCMSPGICLYACYADTPTSTECMAPQQPQQQQPQQPTDALPLTDIHKEHVLRIKNLLADAFARLVAQDTTAIQLLSPGQTARDNSPDDPHHQRLVRVRGVVRHIRRYTQGPSFFSIATAPSVKPSVASPDGDGLGVLQVALHDGVSVVDAEEAMLSPETVLRVLHKRDVVVVIGAMARNQQGGRVVRLRALRFEQSEVQSYR